MAAALNVTEPCSTGIGGDAFALFYDAKQKDVKCLLGSGRSPAGLTPELVEARGYQHRLPLYSGLTVTVPGAAAHWADLSQRHGRLPLATVLEPAIELAEGGFPVSKVTAHLWKAGVPQLLGGGLHGADMLINGTRAPLPGEIFTNPHLAGVLRRVAQDGAAGFYQGRIASAVVEATQLAGGVLSMEDMASHSSLFEDPICTTYGGLEVWEVGPPTQGITALIGLNILEVANKAHGDNDPLGNDCSALHRRIESTRLAFADALSYIADTQVTNVDTAALLDKDYAARRAQVIQPRLASKITAGQPTASEGGNETVYFCCVDGDGNGCSMINSNYMGFGTGIVPERCGFTLHNRGHNFSLVKEHPNCLAPNKRPYHTIIPGMCTYGPGSTSLANCFGVMGGFMQPQGHIQVISNMLDLGMDPQEALDAPRYRVDDVGDSASDADVLTSKVSLEEGFSSDCVDELENFGHEVKWPITSYQRCELFGRGQIITRDPKSGVLCGGSDPRADGLAIGW